MIDVEASVSGPLGGQDFKDEMLLMMRSSGLRATGKEIKLYECSDNPASSDYSRRDHEKEWHEYGLNVLITSPATVRPNVKRFNMPWKTLHNLLVSGSGEAIQGVPLASRVLGEWSSGPGQDFMDLGNLVNPTYLEGPPLNAEFSGDGRSLKVLISNPLILCVPEVIFNPFNFSDYPSGTGFHKDDKSDRSASPRFI